MNFIIETERLLLRMFSEKDAQLIFELNQDKEVTRFTHDPVRDLEQAKEILETVILPQYALYNLGRWAIHVKPELEFIGWCGLKYRSVSDEIDLGYRLKKEYWGKGFATEAASASVKYGFQRLSIKRIVGRAELGNIASCIVLEKCGMTYIGEGLVDGYPVKTYEIIKPDLELK